METKQTAVDWLVENAEDFFGGLLAPSIIERAKQIERQQLIDFANNAYEYAISNWRRMDKTVGEELYNETYNKKPH